MRKLFCLFLFLNVLFGCSSDDEFESVNPNLLIGEWKLKSTYSSDGHPFPLNECEAMSYYHFFEDNSFIGDIYDKTHQGCVLDSEEKMNAIYDVVDRELQLYWSEIRLHNKIDIRQIYFIQFPDSNTLELYRYGMDRNKKYLAEVWSRIE